LFCAHAIRGILPLEELQKNKAYRRVLLGCSEESEFDEAEYANQDLKVDEIKS